MALTFDLSDVLKPADLYVKDEDSDREILNWRYSVIIMPGTIITGIGALTEKTIPEFYARLSAYEKLHGALGRNGDGSDHYTALEDIVKLKGLRTNVFPVMTRTKWMNQQVKHNYLDAIVKDTEKRLPSIEAQIGEEIAKELGLA